MPNFKTKFYTDFCRAGANNAHYVLKRKIDSVIFVALKTAIKFRIIMTFTPLCEDGYNSLYIIFLV